MNLTEFIVSKAPPRLLWADWEQRFVVVVGSLLDILADGATYALQCRFIDYAPSDALPYLGRDRKLERGPNEPDATWRARLFAAWDSWAWAGTVHPDGLLGQLVAWGFTDGTDVPVLVESQHAYYPPRAKWWSRFWIVIPQSCNPYTGAPPADTAATVATMVLAFRPGNVPCEHAVFIEAGERLIGWPRDGYTIGEAMADGLTFGDSVVHRVVLDGKMTP